MLLDFPDADHASSNTQQIGIFLLGNPQRSADLLDAPPKPRSDKEALALYDVIKWGVIQLRIGLPMQPWQGTAAQQGGIGGIDDVVRLQPGDVALPEGNAGFPDGNGQGPDRPECQNFPLLFCQVEGSAMVSITSQCSAILPFSTRHRS